MSRGTLWGGAYNSVVEYVDHHRTNYEANPEQYLGGVMFGAGIAVKTKAYNTAVAIKNIVKNKKGGVKNYV